MHDLDTIQKMNTEEMKRQRERVDKIYDELGIVVEEWQDSEIEDVGDFLLYWAERISAI